MNKIIIVGHPQSGYEDIERLLVSCGMKEALPSRREGLLPAQISDTLVKAHGAVPVMQLHAADKLRQIEVAAVWQGLALDLMLANVEQRLWGWADTQAVYLLDYWKAQDPQIVFILVYDTPQAIYTRLSLEQAAAPPEELQRLMDSWTAYNEALLHFHLRNPDRSLLVHAQQVRESAQTYLQQVRARIDVPLRAPSELQGDSGVPVIASDTRAEAPIGAKNHRQRPSGHEIGQQGRQSHTPDAEMERAASGASAVALMERPSVEQGGTSDFPLESNALAGLLAAGLVDSNVKATQLYAELQAAASLPYGEMATAEAGGATDAQRYQAWRTLVGQQAALRHWEDRAQTQEQQIRALGEKAERAGQQAEETCRQLENRHRLDQEQITALQAQVDGLQAELHAASEELGHLFPGQAVGTLQSPENGLLLVQLRRAQDELERLRAEQAHLEQESQALRPLVKQGEQLRLELENLSAQAADREEQIARLQTQVADFRTELRMTRATGTQQQRENDLLLTQLRQAQDGLEQLHAENQELRSLRPVANEAQQLRAELTALSAQSAGSTEQISRLKAQVADLQTELRVARAAGGEEQQREIDVLLAQLRQAQDELERLHAEIRELRALRPMVEQAEKLRSEQANLSTQLSDRTRQIAHLQAQTAELRTELGMARATASQQRQENNLLLVQLHRAQDELESSYADNTQTAARLQEQVLHMQAELRAAEEKDRQLLQVQADEALQKQENSLLLKQLHRVQDELEHLYAERMEQVRELEYLRQAEKQSADLRQQLAHLGSDVRTLRGAAAEHEQESALLLEQLHKAQDELESHYLKARGVSGKSPAGQGAAQPKPQVYYGAAERIKQQLSYRLGRVMLDQATSVSGWLRMPFSLRAEVRRFHLDQKARQGVKLPPIARYRDAQEAEAVKQHLAYRLGTTMIAHGRSFRGWLSLPWALRREIKQFRNQQQQ